MKSEDVEARLASIFAEFVPDARGLAAAMAGTPLAEALAMDSAAFLLLVVSIEEQFDISFDADDIEAAFVTFESLVVHIKMRLA